VAVSAARAAAFEILLRVEREDSYAAELLHSAASAKLSARDHGLTTELVMGVLRWRALLDGRVAASSSQKIERMDVEVLTALRLGAYQLLFLSRVPARAAIFESVELVKAARKRSAAGLVNAVLRKVGGAAGAADFFVEIESAANAEELALAAAHPRWMVERWVARYGLEAARGICAYDQRVPETAIHIDDGRCEEELTEAGVELAPGRLLARARRVVAGDVTRTLAYREGPVAIQDEGSQLVALLAGRGEAGVDGADFDGAILDCCAAPGSKTSLMARRNPQALVVAADLHAHRARLLRTLCRAPNVFVVAADAQFLPFNSRFDRVLADVPCSGTGTMGRNPEIKWRLREGDLRDLQGRQIAILKSALEQVAAGGRLVYSTCSLEREENEAVVEAALAGAVEFEVVDCREELELLRAAGEIAGGVEIGSMVDGVYLRTIPGVQGCDGFFAAVIGRR
jgi:16S rRNA (cytosine967-C5)-methyltransferase